MADLKSLFAKKATPDGQPSVTGTQASPDSNKPASGDSSPSGTGELQTPAETPAPANGEPSNPVKKKLTFGVRGPSQPATSESVSGSGTDSSGEQPKPRLGSLFKSAGTRTPDSNSGGVAAPSLDSLDALNSSEDEGIEPSTGGPSVTYFADETPAVKPTRNLPEGMTKEQLGFVETIDTIYDIIHDPDLLGGVVRNIMIELKSNAEYTKLMAPEDFRTMVRGMRESMGLARVKKQETKAKKTSTGSRKSKALDDDVMAGLDDILGGIV